MTVVIVLLSSAWACNMGNIPAVVSVEFYIEDTSLNIDHAGMDRFSLNAFHKINQARLLARS